MRMKPRRPEAALSISPFERSRWRLRRTRQLWVLHAVLVLPYYFWREIKDTAKRPAEHGTILYQMGSAKQGRSGMSGMHIGRPAHTRSVRRASAFVQTRFMQTTCT